MGKDKDTEHQIDQHQVEQQQQQQRPGELHHEFNVLDQEGRIHTIAYKKLPGELLTDAEKHALLDGTNDGTIKGWLLYLAAQHLLLDTLGTLDVLMI
ncbi:hypothetical protein DFQ29_000299, partial [Apophysomyces sp. BC1021]